MLTGTSTRRSAVGGCSRSVSDTRSAPATTARTTSLTVPPRFARTSLISASGNSSISKRRCGPMGWFKGDSGARPMVKTPSSGLRPVAMLPRSFNTSLFGSSASRAIFKGCESCSLTERHEQLGQGWRLAWRPGFGRFGRVRVWLGVEQDRREVDARDAVQHAVMRLADDRELVPANAFHEPQFPQRLVAIELLGEEPADQLLQLGLAARDGQGGAAHVVLEVELRLVDPHGPALLERHLENALPIARHLRQPRLHEPQHVAERRRRAFEDGAGAHVHVRGAIFEVEEHRV